MLPPELILNIILFLNPHSLVKFALSCHWLFREISNRKHLWKEYYYKEFSFDRDDYELKWLQQLWEQQRSSNSLSASTNEKPRGLRSVRRVKREKKTTEVDWFRAYCWRQQTAYNLSYFTPSQRTIFLPEEYHQRDWKLWSANPLCLVFTSQESKSILTYQHASSIGKRYSSSKSTYPITTKDSNKASHFNRLTYDGDRALSIGHIADRDVLVARVDEETNEDDVDDTNTFLWRMGPNYRLKTHWPCSSDVDIGSPCKWEVELVQHDWMTAYTGTVDGHKSMRVFNINHARWCGGVVSSHNFHFRTTTPDTAQVFCYSYEIMNDYVQVTFQLWEYQPYGTNERCLKSETITLNNEEVMYAQSCVNDKQSAVMFAEKDKNNLTDPITLILYLTDSSYSLSLKWKVNLSNQPKHIEFLPGRQEVVVSTKSTIGYVLNLSDGTLLHTFNVSLYNPLIAPILGSVCLYRKRNITNQHLIDTQTGRDYSFSDKGVHSDIGSSEYGCLCAKRHIVGNQLTLLSWHYSQQ